LLFNEKKFVVYDVPSISYKRKVKIETDIKEYLYCCDEYN